MEHERSKQLYEEAKHHLAGGVSSNVRYASVPVPLFFARGEGARLTDEDGNVFIDYILGNGPALLGHAPPRVLAAVADSLADGQTFGGQHRRELELSRRITEIVPSAELVRFASSGTEAVQMALRIARAFTGRRKIVKFEGGYHGWMDSVYVSNRIGDHSGPVEAPNTVPDTPGAAPGASADTVVASWNSIDHLRAAFDAHPGEIAAVIMEPMMVNAGVVLPLPGYLEAAKQLCHERGALFILDEVITGFRLGLRGAQGRFGVKPDMSVFAKAVAAGFPLALVAGRRDVMEILHKGVMHGGTYNGNVQSMAAGLATLDILTEDDGAVYREMEARGTELMDGLKALAAKHGLEVQVNGVPTMFQTIFCKETPRNARETAAGNADPRTVALHAALQKRGVRVTTKCSWFFSAAHDSKVVAETLRAADGAMEEVAAMGKVANGANGHAH
ncbi:class III aminotransferase [Hyaloraphidium curvatum]|nr:class III aminotransferase [Hyaloraphidium curvatum]